MFFFLGHMKRFLQENLRVLCIMCTKCSQVLLKADKRARCLSYVMIPTTICSPISDQSSNVQKKAASKIALVRIQPCDFRVDLSLLHDCVVQGR